MTRSTKLFEMVFTLRGVRGSSDKRAVKVNNRITSAFKLKDYTQSRQSCLSTSETIDNKYTLHRITSTLNAIPETSSTGVRCERNYTKIIISLSVLIYCYATELQYTPQVDQLLP